jgi:predicted NUDIX family NTP pyrophosphohydrolase
MPKKSAGILMYRNTNKEPEVFLVHPGGPFWAKKDNGAWSIPKGEFSEEENPQEAAMREFQEETGFEATGTLRALEPVKQPSGKMVFAWSMEGDVNADAIKSNTFTMEWPPHSGQRQEFPEIDRAAWFGIGKARKKILKGQIPLLEQLKEILK